MNRGSLAQTALGAVMLLVTTWGVQAADLRIIAATPLKGVIKDLTAQFERQSRHKLSAKFVSGPIVKREIEADAAYDLAISITPVIDALIRDGRLQAATRADVAYAIIGLGVRAGAPKPDISTVEGFKKTLLGANSVAHSATGASGDHFKKILQKLGIAEQMQPKLRPMPAEAIGQAVPSGQAEMIVVTAPVILVPGAELVGPIPAELQFYNTFAAAIGSQSANPDGARDFLRLLTAPGAMAVLKAHGMEAGLPK
jgi:molybdate transport system substrate-binding protein